jgi:hypothetical protein
MEFKNGKSLHELDHFLSSVTLPFTLKTPLKYLCLVHCDVDIGTPLYFLVIAHEKHKK